MIKWFMSTLAVAAVVAAVMIIYLSPDLRAKTKTWLTEKNALVLKRVKALGNSLPGKSDLKQAKDHILPKDQPSQTKGQESKPGTGKKTQPSKPAMQDQISEKDRKELEKILEQAQKK